MTAIMEKEARRRTATARPPDAPMAGRTVLITGATSGIGYETALGLARMGATVVGVGRSLARCEAAAASIRRATSGGSIDYEVADLSSQTDIRALARRIRARFERLDVLINNAGAFAGKRVTTADGIETQLAVNVLAPFLLTNELMPLLAASGDGRVISLSSGSHFGARLDGIDFDLRGRYHGLRCYGATKLACILWTRELARRLGSGSSVSTFSVDPGLVNTDMGLKDSRPLVRLVWRVRRRGGISPTEGAATSIYLASDPACRHRSGEYWKSCEVAPSSPQSRDLAEARRLWAMCEELCARASAR